MAMRGSSTSVVNDRIKNGQCVHCGIHTHEVKKKRFSMSLKTPLTIPGKVDHGCCLRQSCIDAGANVPAGQQLSSSSSSSIGMSADTMSAVGSAVGSVIGTLVDAPEMGEAIGGGVGNIVGSLTGGNKFDNDTSQTSHSSYLSGVSSSGGGLSSDPLMQHTIDQQNVLSQHYMNQAQNDLAQLNQQLAFQQQQQQPNAYDVFSQQYSSQAQDLQRQLNEMAFQAQQQSNAAQSQLQNIIAQAQNDQQVAAANLAQSLGQMTLQPGTTTTSPMSASRCVTPDEDQKLALLYSKMQRGLFQADILCPNKHVTVVHAINGARQCDLCKVVTTVAPMVGCQQCDYDLCLSCLSDAKVGGKATANQECCNGHKAYRKVIRSNIGFICNYCGETKPKGTVVFYCSLCDWGTCVLGVCADRAKSAYVRCPGQNHCATLSKVNTLNVCDICYAEFPTGTEVFKCHLCDWSVCLKHSGS